MRAPSAVSTSVMMLVAVVLLASGPQAATAARTNNRKMLQWGDYSPSASANSNTAAINNGFANGPVTANAFSQANGGGFGGGPGAGPDYAPQPAFFQQPPPQLSIQQGPYGQSISTGSGMFGMFGRKMLQWGGGYFPSWFGGAQANSNAAAINNGVANGPITANAFSQANGYGGGPASANSNAVAMNNGVANGGVTANAASVAYGH